MSTNELTADEFREMSSKVHHKWMDVEQLDDFNLFNFIKMEVDKETYQEAHHIIIQNRDIHPEYKLEKISFIVDRDNEEGNDPYLTEYERESMQTKRLYLNVPININEHHFYIDTEDTSDMTIIAEVVSNDEGLLDIELEQTIDFYGFNK
jgi:hypothetical protein